MRCHVFKSQEIAKACIAYINGASWFPIVGNVSGKPAPDKQKTERWMNEPLEMITGEWAVVCIPEIRMEAAGVPEEDREKYLVAFDEDVSITKARLDSAGVSKEDQDQLIATFGKDIREVSSEDIKLTEEESPEEPVD